MKKSVVIAAAAGAVVLAGAGIFAAVRMANRKPVQVVPVQEMSMGGMGGTTNMSAMVSSDVSQNIYVTKNQKIQEIYVQEGQQVKVGDPLISYDMTLANLNLEIEEMKQEGIQLRIQKAEQDLKLLKAGKVPEQISIGNVGGSAGTGGGTGAKTEDDAEATAAGEKARVRLLSLSQPQQEKKESVSAAAQEEKTTATATPTPVDKPESTPGQSPTPTDKPESTPGQSPTPTDKPESTGTPDPGDKPGTSPSPSPVPTQSPTPTEKPVTSPTAKPDPEKPADGGPDYKDRIYKRLDYDSYPMSGKGTEKEPYIFVCQANSVVITGSFLNKMAGYPDTDENKAPDKEKDPQGNPVKGYRFKIETYGGEVKAVWIGNGEKLPWIHSENVFVLENQEALEKLGQALRPEVDAELLRSAVEAALIVAQDPGAYQMGPEMEAFLAALEKAQEILAKVDREESVLQTAINEAREQLTEAQKQLIPAPQGGGSIGGGVIGGGSSGPTYTKEEIQKMKEDKEKELRQLNLDLRQAELNVRKLAGDMKNQSINSTINGTVKSVGDPENPDGGNGDPFIQVVSSDGLYVQGNLSELLLDQVQEGQLAFGYGYESGVSFQAEIREVSLYPASGNYFWGGGNSNVSYYPFIAYIEDAAGLKNYEMVELNLQLDNQGEAASSESVYLSKAFIRSEDGIDYVMKDDGSGKLVRQEVQLGQLYYGSYEILSGLTLEDKVAFPYGKAVKEGAKTEDISYMEFLEDAYA
ncbi:MAG TPA: hypothetical protein IAB98_00220 [Candidatus Egerieimonas intestinavium]|uniref:YknX-like barrel-sandwich hybrid domain-containing protein n=1 Tax=Candidatus Egerieimonas intestinavium TaxID=2840777 RepID=A0A9D1EHU1_9FIRM|nr:hypothetical protein [Candidatus Egerieimonas intestinavium]